jgi:hypothetical protein
MLFTAVASLLFASTALAQSVPTAFGVAVNKTLDLYFGTQYITPGLMIKRSSTPSPPPPKNTANTFLATAKAPTIGLTGETLPGTYLLAMIDIDVQQSGKRTTVLHALLQDFKSSGTVQNGTNVLTTKATGPSSYFQPAPPAETPQHPHNYVFVLHEQPANFAVPSAHKQAVSSRFGIDWVKFIKDAGLSAPVAGNYIQVQSGDNSKREVEFQA